MYLDDILFGGIVYLITAILIFITYHYCNDTVKLCKFCDCGCEKERIIEEYIDTFDTFDTQWIRCPMSIIGSNCKCKHQIQFKLQTKQLQNTSKTSQISRISTKENENKNNNENENSNENKKNNSGTIELMTAQHESDEKKQLKAEAKDKDEKDDNIIEDNINDNQEMRTLHVKASISDDELRNKKSKYTEKELQQSRCGYFIKITDKYRAITLVWGPIIILVVAIISFESLYAGASFYIAGNVDSTFDVFTALWSVGKNSLFAIIPFWQNIFVTRLWTFFKWLYIDVWSLRLLNVVVLFDFFGDFENFRVAILFWKFVVWVVYDLRNKKQQNVNYHG